MAGLIAESLPPTYDEAVARQPAHPGMEMEMIPYSFFCCEEVQLELTVGGGGDFSSMLNLQKSLALKKLRLATRAYYASLRQYITPPEN